MPRLRAFVRQVRSCLRQRASHSRPATTDYIDLEGLRWTFTRIVAEDAAGVLVCGVAFKNVPDPRLAWIPAHSRLRGRPHAQRRKSAPPHGARSGSRSAAFYACTSVCIAKQSCVCSSPRYVRRRSRRADLATLAARASVHEASSEPDFQSALAGTRPCHSVRGSPVGTLRRYRRAAGCPDIAGGS